MPGVEPGGFTGQSDLMLDADGNVQVVPRKGSISAIPLVAPASPAPVPLGTTTQPQSAQAAQVANLQKQKPAKRSNVAVPTVDPWPSIKW